MTAYKMKQSIDFVLICGLNMKSCFIFLCTDVDSLFPVDNSYCVFSKQTEMFFFDFFEGVFVSPYSVFRFREFF